MSDGPLLSRLLNETAAERATVDHAANVVRALAIDPALRGRVRCDKEGVVILSDLAGRVPSSAKERARWELHVRLRVTAECGAEVAGTVSIRWIGASSTPALENDHQDSGGFLP